MPDEVIVAEAPAQTAPAPAGEGNISPRDAARHLASWRHNRDKQPKEQDKPVEAAPAEAEAAEPPAEELADEANAAPPEVEAPGETQEAEPEAELPTIEPPRSWTKEEKEEFKSYPREAQEKIARREQERERSLRQSQNEAAEQRKAIEAEREAVKQARQHYDQALPQLLETLQTQQAGEFSDIKTYDDVQRLAREDWPRYIQWDAKQKQIASVQHEMRLATERKEQESAKEWTEFATKQDQLFADKVPDIADAEKSKKLREGALTVLRDLGFTDQELAGMWNGKEKVSLRDHRLQLLVLDGVKYREAQTAKKQVAAKPLPPVQRPGVAPPRGQADSEKIQTLSNKLSRTGSLKDAAALLTAQRKAATRR